MEFVLTIHNVHLALFKRSVRDGFHHKGTLLRAYLENVELSLWLLNNFDFKDFHQRKKNYWKYLVAIETMENCRSIIKICDDVICFSNKSPWVGGFIFVLMLAQNISLRLGFH